MRSAILRALAMSWVIETAVAPSSLHAFDDQVVDDVGHDRVEAGGRLVEEDDLGLGGDGAGQRHALLHAAGELGRAELADLGRRARPRRASASAISRACGARHAAPWIRPKATFSQTRQRIEQRAALEQHAELAHQPARARRGRSPTVSSPSIRIEPASGCRRPRMHLISTDLPVPEPPMTTSDLAGAARRGRCRRARASARRTSADAARARSWARRVAHRAKNACGEDVVERRGSGSRPRPPRWSSPAPTPCGAALRVIAVIAAHQRDR